jgi:hypothetical protein
MRIYNEVVEKFGDLVIDFEKTAVFAGFAGLFIEKIGSTISIATIFIGMALICTGFYAFYFKNRRREDVDATPKET